MITQSFRGHLFKSSRQKVGRNPKSKEDVEDLIADLQQALDRLE
jgi:hypothetical protein